MLVGLLAEPKVPQSLALHVTLQLKPALVESFRRLTLKEVVAPSSSEVGGVTKLSDIKVLTTGNVMLLLADGLIVGEAMICTVVPSGISAGVE
jgi:hypothetical protein